MFDSYKVRVDKHLSIFNKAVLGLRQVQADIANERASLFSHSERLRAQIEENKSRDNELLVHHMEIGATADNITRILPVQAVK